MPDPDPFYAPKPDKIKTVIVIVDNGTAAPYPDLLSALTAVYRLGALVQQHIAEILQKTSALNRDHEGDAQ
jgi:hypothetical protein